MTKKRSRPAKAASASATNEVDEFLAELEHPLKAGIEAVRAFILGADKRVREGVKWNAPSFYVTEHFATFKLRPMTTVQVVFHTGAKVRPDAGAMKIDDPTGLLKWVAKDRCVATLSDMSDIEAKKAAFVSIVKQWIEQTSSITP
jgi:hypothetical protein